MLELVDMPGMSAQFRICRMRTANSNKVGGMLNGNLCAPKLRVPKYPLVTFFVWEVAPSGLQVPFSTFLTASCTYLDELKDQQITSLSKTTFLGLLLSSLRIWFRMVYSLTPWWVLGTRSLCFGGDGPKKYKTKSKSPTAPNRNLGINH